VETYLKHIHDCDVRLHVGNEQRTLHSIINLQCCVAGVKFIKGVGIRRIGDLFGNQVEIFFDFTESSLQYFVSSTGIT
jgi:hypothetical protein